MRQSCIVLILIVAMSAMAAASQNPARLLDTVDRLSVREAQLNLALANISSLQAEAQVIEAKIRIGQLLQSLKKQYACPDCTLNDDFTWTAAPKETPPATTPNAATPTPKKQGGTNQKKE